MRSRNRKGGPRGEEDCPIRRLRERYWVTPLERGGDLDVIDFFQGPREWNRCIRSQKQLAELENRGTLLSLHFIFSWF